MIRARPGFLSILSLLIVGVTASAAPKAVSRVQTDIDELTKISGGRVGVAAWRVDGKGAQILSNADERFPMASTFKVAVAGAILADVDAGRLSLDKLIAIDPALYVPSDIIAERLVHPGVSLSVHNLLELMLTESDNTATDVLVGLAGGPTAVTKWVEAQGVRDLRVDRDTAGLLRDFFGLPPGPFQQALEAAVKADPQLEEKGALPNAAFDNDPRDTATPRAMGNLLTRIFSGRALSAGSTKELIAIMERCRTGAGRLKGKLPEGAVVAHKTGTIGGSVNDVGVLTLPDGQGSVVIAIFVKGSEAPFERREQAIAEIARSLRDYFLYIAE